MNSKAKAWIPKIARYLLGVVFFLSGGAGLLGLAQPPPDTPENLMNYFNAMVATSYFFPLLKGTETVCGLLLLIGYAPALALVILAPISVNIFFVHAFLTPGVQNLIIPLVLIVLHVTAATAYWRIYRPLFAR